LERLITNVTVVAVVDCWCCFQVW